MFLSCCRTVVGGLYLCFLCFIQSLGDCIYMLSCSMQSPWFCAVRPGGRTVIGGTVDALLFCQQTVLLDSTLPFACLSIVGWTSAVETYTACPLLSLPQVPCWRIDASVRGTFGDLPVHMPGPFPSLGYKFFAACVYLLPHQYISQLTFLLLYVSRASKPGLRHDYVLRVITYNVCQCVFLNLSGVILKGVGLCYAVADYGV